MSESVSFPNADGHRLAGRLDLPEGREPLAYALFAHCFTCSKDLRAARRLTRALTDEGYGVLAFDFTGLGQSEGEFAATTFAHNVEDLTAAAAFLRTAREAPRLLIGHSLGGSAVLCAAALIPEADAVCTVGAPADPAHVLHHIEGDEAEEIRLRGEAEVTIGGRPFRVGRAFLDELAKPQQMAERLAALDKALLVMHAPTDRTVGIENARTLFERARHPKSFVSLDTADHLLSDPADAEYAARVLAAWAARYLPGEEMEEGDEREQKSGYTTDHVTAQIGTALRTAIQARGLPLVADEPAKIGGTEAGPTPFDLVAAGLAACTAMTVRLYADRKGWPLDGVDVQVDHDRVAAPDGVLVHTRDGKLDRYRVGVVFIGDLSNEQRARLLEIAGRCPVHRSLTSGAVVDVETGSPA
jgi:putative redox protein